jgi:hypothetical protein
MQIWVMLVIKTFNALKYVMIKKLSIIGTIRLLHIKENNFLGVYSLNS